jgi:enoyl-CoA hydratase
MIREAVDGSTLVITIDRPAQRNAVDAAVTQGIERAIDHLEDDPGLRFGVLTGAGSVFCAGGDLGVLGAGRFAELETRGAAPAAWSSARGLSH